jgi:hypothetical protein
MAKSTKQPRGKHKPITAIRWACAYRGINGGEYFGGMLAAERSDLPESSINRPLRIVQVRVTEIKEHA